MTKDLDWKTGHNLDAFNDLLRGGFGVHDYEEPITIIWENSEKSKDELGYEATITHYSRRLGDKQFSQDIIIKLLQELQDNRGQTLFEIIVEIISEHGHIELLLR